MKKIGLSLGVLIVIMVGAILIVPSFLNWNKYKVQIEETASDLTGRDVKIKGDISLSLLPISALSVKDVTVTNLDGGRAEYMLSLKSLDIKVSFPSVIASLFGGKVKVEKFILVDPVVALEIMADGRVNWDMGLGTSEGQGAATSADISLDKFQIVNGQVSFEDMASRQKELIRKINANVKVKSINGPFDVAGSARYKGLEATIAINLGKNRPGKKVPVKLIVSALDGRVKANILGGVILSGKDSVFAGKIDVQARDAGDIFTVANRYKGQKPSGANQGIVNFGQDFAFDSVVELTSRQMSVTDLNIRMGQSRGQGNLEATLGEKLNILAALSVNKLDLDPLLSVFPAQQKAGGDTRQVTGGEPETVTGELWGRLSGKLDLKLGALKYNGKIANQINLNFLARDGVIDISRIQGRMPGGSALNFKGQITPLAGEMSYKPQLTGDLSLNASNLRGLLSWLKVDVENIPGGQLAQFSYKSGLKVTSELVQFFSMAGKLDGLSFGGGVSYALGGRPSYGINLDVRNLNIDSYLAPVTSASDQNNDLGKSLTLLDEFDVRYKIGISNVTAQGMKIHSGQLEGLLLGGVLEAKTIQLTDAAGVSLLASAQGRSFSSKPEFAINFSADAASLATLQRVLKLDDQFDLRRLGRVKLAGDISSTLEKMDVNLKSGFGGSKFDVKGTIRSATLKKFPEFGSIDLDVKGQSKSLAKLIDQWDLPLTRPKAGDDRPVVVKGRVKASSDLTDVDGKITVAGGEVVVKGRARGKGQAATLDIALDLKGSDTREFIRGLGIDFQPSAKKLGPIALKMKVTGTGDQYAFNNIVGDVGPVKLSGSGKLNMALAKPLFNFNLKAGDIPLHDFLMENRDKASAGQGKDFGQWTRDRMDLSLLSSYEGKARVSAASLRYNGYIFDNPTFETDLKDGILSINNFTGRLFGGDVALSGTFGGSGKPDMALDMTLKKASLAQAAQSAAGIAPVTGFFDLTGKFTGKGISQFDMMSSLTGDGNISASPGLISGIDIPALSKRLSDMGSNNAFLKLLGATLSGGETSYKGGMSKITVKEGKIQFSPFDIELDGAKSKVKMAIDLMTWTIRSDGRLSLVDHPNAPPIGVSITGDVSQPNVVYKTDRLKKYVGAKIASSMLQKLVGGEGGLEGIFGNPQKEKVSVAPAGVSETKQPAPEEEDKPAEEFGKRLLQKLFEKKPENKTAPNP